MRGRREASANLRGCRTVSSIELTIHIRMASIARYTTNDSRSGQGAYCASTPASNAPTLNPTMFPQAAMSDARDLSRPLMSSATHAAPVPEAIPIAKPLMTRAANSHAVSWANRKTSVLSMPTPMAGNAVRRRPT